MQTRLQEFARNSISNWEHQRDFLFVGCCVDFDMYYENYN